MMRHALALSILLVTTASSAAGCGDRVEALTDVAVCRAWSEGMDRCAAAAPLVLRSALKSLLDAAAKESKNAASAAGLRDACQAALDSTAAHAKAICPTIVWVEAPN